MEFQCLKQLLFFILKMNELELIKKALPEIARRMENELAIKCPVDKGRLKNSIKVRPTPRGLIIWMVEYGKYVEFGCFYKDTILIKTNKGNKKLKDLKIGELIWTGKDYKKLIQKEKLELGYSIKKIKIKTKNKMLEVTEDHPIWINKGWKKAGDLKKGDKIKRIW